MIADPIRSTDYSKYHGVHCMTPNRLEAELATGMTDRPARGRPRGRPDSWSNALEMECVLVTLDRDGMALVHADGRAELRADPAAAGLRHHRRGRHGPLGRRPLPGRRGRLRRGRRAWATSPAAWRSRRSASPCSRARRSSATCSTTTAPRPASGSTARRLRRRGRPPARGRADGRLHQRLLRPAPRRPRPPAPPGGRRRAITSSSGSTPTPASAA